jgi:hypothetical protein
VENNSCWHSSSLVLQSESGLDLLHCTPLVDIICGFSMWACLWGQMGSSAPCPNPQPGRPGYLPLAVGSKPVWNGGTYYWLGCCQPRICVDWCRQGCLLGKTHAFNKVEVSSGGTNEISSNFFWKIGRWSLSVAVVNQLVSSRGLLKRSRGHAADCIACFILKTLGVGMSVTQHRKCLVHVFSTRQR